MLSCIRVTGRKVTIIQASMLSGLGLLFDTKTLRKAELQLGTAPTE